MDDPIGIREFDAYIAGACAFFLEALVREPKASALALSTEIYCLAYISIAKQGNITGNKLTSICGAITEETGRMIVITIEEVKSFSSSFKPFINANNAHAVCEGLRVGLENFSLRLCITMQQATRSGMTSYWMVWEALTLCTDFDWISVTELIPQDFRSYSHAVVRVGNNPYYGFNSDLGAAKQTNYMSLSWVASKVLMKNDPPTYSALSRYRGLPTAPKKHDELQELIEAYIPGVPDAERAVGVAALQLVRAGIDNALQVVEGRDLRTSYPKLSGVVY